MLSAVMMKDDGWVFMFIP